jgi:hypothetical protein
MAGLTLADAEARLADWLLADAAVADNQTYSIAGRSLSRADAKEIRENIQYWNDWCKELAESESGLIVSQFAPTDD